MTEGVYFFVVCRHFADTFFDLSANKFNTLLMPTLSMEDDFFKKPVMTIDKSRIKAKVGEIRNPKKLCDREEKIMISFGIGL